MGHQKQTSLFVSHESDIFHNCPSFQQFCDNLNSISTHGLRQTVLQPNTTTAQGNMPERLMKLKFQMLNFQ